MKNLIQLVWGIFVWCILGWGIGFLLFGINFMPTPLTTPKTDVIVVLTGGPDRIAAGLQLLQKQNAPILFVSGVNPSVTRDEFATENGITPAQMKHVILGHQATTTLENAQETAQWVAAQHHKSLTLVTAHYHMPRSLIEFKKYLPHTVIVPYPIVPGDFSVQWWQSPSVVALAFREYNKYLGALVRSYMEVLPVL